MKTFYLGGDASKGYMDFVLLDERKRLVEEAFRLDDTFDGHAHLFEKLLALCEQHPEAEIKVGLESSGGYENNWLASLRRFEASLPIRAARLNPSYVQHYAKGEGIRVTTDAVSATYIAGFLIAHPDKVDYERRDTLASLKSHWCYIDQLVGQRRVLLTQLQGLLYQTHPGLIRYLKSGMPNWVLALLKQYPTARRLSRARAATVAKIPYVNHERATELVTQARQSVASAGDDVIAHLVQELAQHLQQLDGTIDQQKKQLAGFLTADPRLADEVTLLKSYGSIGDYTAVGLMLEIGSASRFASAKKIASFFGVHPAFKQSGDGMSAVRMSKRGSPRMRSLLFMITINAVQHHPVIAPYYKHLTEERGMARMAALGACMHKTLRILYGMLKNGQPFDPEVERGHRRRPQTAPSTSRLRRYQDPDDAAPISRREEKKRRQQKGSQSAIDAVNGMPTSAAAVDNERPAPRQVRSKNQPHGA